MPITTRPIPVAPAIPPGWRLYVVGDVHGRLDLLTDLERQIEHELASAPAQVLTIFLGDIIDRGPRSAGVIERLASGAFCTPVRVLRGNHEDLFLDFLDNASLLDQWRKIGGLETLFSYRVDVCDAMRGVGYQATQQALVATLPATHRRFLESTATSYELGDYFFCHAGVRPGVPLDNQTDRDLLWIRSKFLDFEGSFGKIIVHGHSPIPKPEIRPNRINLDTGAYASSLLSVLALEGDTRRILSIDRRTPGLVRTQA